MKIVYRVVNGLLAALIFPVLIFMDLFMVRLGTTEKLSSFFEKLTVSGSSGVAIEEAFSIKRIIDIFTGKDDLAALLNISNKANGPIYWPKEMSPLNTRIIVFAVAFVLIVAAALFILIWSCCSNKHLPVFIASLVGIIAVIVFIGTFNSISNSIYTGEVNVIDFVVDQIIGSELLASIVGFAASAAVTLFLSFGGAQNAVLFIFIALFCWTVIFFLADLGDPKVKEEKEAEKAAALAKKQAKAKKKAEKNAQKEQTSKA